MEVGSKSTGVCASVVKSTLDISHFLMEVAGAGLDTPFGALTCDLRVIPCRTGRYGVSSSLVEANLEGKTLQFS